MTSKLSDDCYFFYYSTCKNGIDCPYRHCTEALGTEIVCTLWSKTGRCYKKMCPFRHMKIEKVRSGTDCFWETQSDGCRKPYCVFKHSKPRLDFSAQIGINDEKISEPVAKIPPTIPVVPSKKLRKSKHVWVNPAFQALKAPKIPPKKVLPILPTVDFDKTQAQESQTNRKQLQICTHNDRKVKIGDKNGHEKRPVDSKDLRNRLGKRRNDSTLVENDDIQDLITELSTYFDEDHSPDWIIENLLKNNTNNGKKPTINSSRPVKLRKKWKSYESESESMASHSGRLKSE